MNLLGSLLGFTLVLGSLAVLFAILTLIFYICCMFILFNKAGENPVKALIPFYNTAILAKIAHVNPFIAFIIAILSTLIEYISLPVLIFKIISVGYIIFSIILTIKLAKLFNFPVSLALIITILLKPIIFYAMLAFGPFDYIGSKKKMSNANSAFILNGSNKNYEPQSDFFK